VKKAYGELKSTGRKKSSYFDAILREKRKKAKKFGVASKTRIRK